MAEPKDYGWGTTHESGGQFALKVTTDSVSASAPIDVTAAVRNPKGTPITFRDDVALVVDNGSGTREHGGGPRTSTPHTVDPQQTLEFRSWRLSDHGAKRGGSIRLWLTMVSDKSRKPVSNVVTVPVG